MKVNEIFYSLQGEGHYTGTPAVFLRLSGCNLACPFCDTLHQQGEEMMDDEIVRAISKYPARHVVITGGEPALQLTDEFIDLLHREGWFVQIETNGTMPIPDGIDWVTCSPKEDIISGKEGGIPGNGSCSVVLDTVDELKLLFPTAISPEDPLLPRAKDRRLQPVDLGDEARNKEIMQQTIDYLLAHPEWKLSLQTHKILNVR